MGLTKKIASVALSAVLVMAMAPALALADDNPAVATGGPSIQINDSSANTYKAYQIFSGTATSTAKELQGLAWNTTNVNVDALMTALIDASWSTTGVSFTTGMNANQVANMMAKMADNSADANQLATLIGNNLKSDAAAISLTNNSATSVTNAGYYLVRSNSIATGQTGTDFILAVADAVTASPKNPNIPTIDKQIQENSTSNWGETADNNIGDTVNYKITVTLPTGYSTYDHYYIKVTDVLADGLTYTTDSMTITATPASGTASTIAVTPTVSGQTVETVIADLKTTAASLTDDDTVVLTYTATLDSDAVIGGNGNNNYAELTYSNDPTWNGATASLTTGTTAKDYVYDFTYELDLTKQDAFTSAALTGAQFKLANSDKTKYATIADGKITGWVASADSATTITSTNEKYAIQGIDAGTYTLVEIAAPSGYDAMKDKKFTIVVSATTAEATDTTKDTAAGASISSLGVTIKRADDTADATAGTGDTTTGKVSVIVKNSNTATLPSTGGAGTIAFYVVGGLLVIGAVVLLVTRRRSSRKDR